MSTPIRAQYLRLKQPFPDALLLFRRGDFYELYDADAHVAARELGVALTEREFAKGERIPLCLLSYHVAEGHIRKLVACGYKVAIAEQIGDPHTAKGLENREVVRVVTPASAIGVHCHLPSDCSIGPLHAEPDGSDGPIVRRGTAASCPSTSKDGCVNAQTSAPGGGWEEHATAPAVQLALFAWPAGGDGRGR